MIANNRPRRLMFAQSRVVSRITSAGSLRAAALLILFGLLATTFYLPSSATSFRKSLDSRLAKASVQSKSSKAGAQVAARASSLLPHGLNLTSFMASPLLAAEGIATFAADCTTPKDSFELGDVVCAKASGVPASLFPWRILWVDPEGFVRQSDTASPNDATEYTFTLPATPTSVVNGQTVDNRGTWRVNLVRSNGAVRQTALFAVHEPANPVTDLFVQKINRSSDGSAPAGGNIDFIIVVGNQGPDAAADVHLVDSTPSGGTLVQFTQTSGPACVPVEAGVGNDCVMATLAYGERAEFTAIYNVGSAAPGTYETSATVSSAVTVPPTTDPRPDNNTSTTQYTVTAAGSGATCEILCPNNINAIANTTEGTQRGAHVTYAEPVSSGDCGSISSVPASGSFFPVGSTTVTATSETGGGSCSFTITVIDEGSDPPTISCPANPPAANASSSCSAAVTVGTATATGGSNVTLYATRNDGKLMYDCDANGNCTRRSSDDPFSSGETTITWFAYSHDVAGPYTTAGPKEGDTFEEQHRTGTAICTQTVTVNDVTPPTITPPANQAVSAGATCQFTLPDYTASATVSDNCACASSDTSEVCDSRQPITITQSPAPGTVVGLGPHTITLTANDGSSNNGGAGNTASAQFTVTVNDTTAPTITCPASITTGNDAGQCSATVNPGTATAADNCDSNPTVSGSRSDGQSLNAPYPKGTTTITWTATDSAGNHSSCTQTVTVNDTENPAISCPASITSGTDPNSCSAVINPGTATTTDNCPGATVSGTRSDGQALNAPYPKGTTTIIWTATDSSGNHSSCSQAITVNDTQAPTISCQVDIIADYNPAVNGAVVTYTAPVGTDNCPGATTVLTAGLASGSTFPLGTTTNTFRVTDAAGLTATCSFKVTVALTSIIGLDSVSISGASLVDSYSSAGGYPATKGSLANVLSNGTITLAGSGKVAGNVRSTRAGVNMSGATRVDGNATAGTTVSLSGSATVGGTITNNALAPFMTLPPVPACGPPYSPNSGISGTYSYNSSTGDLSLSGVNIATLANGTYCFHNVTVAGSSQLKVNGPVVIRMTGTLNTSGATTFNNTTGIPSNLRVLSSYSGTNGVTFAASSNVHLVIYAPTTGVTISGATPLFGTIAGKTLTVAGSGMIHYDTQLKSIWPDVWTLILGP